MKFIPMRKIAHNLDEEGWTESIEIEFNTYDNGNRINSNLTITQEDIKDVNSNWDIETINKPNLGIVGRRTLRDWVMLERPEEDEEDEE